MKFTTKRHPSKAILAADILNFDEEVAKRVGHGLRALFGATLPLVKGVFVLTPDSTTIPRIWFNDVVRTLAEEASSQMQETFSMGEFPADRPKVLIEPRGSLEDIALRLDQYADTTTAELIVIPSKASNSIGRFVFGSFSETMLQEPGLPLLTVTPKVECKGLGHRRILLAENFLAPSARSFFDQFLAMSRGQLVDLVLVHVGNRTPESARTMQRFIRKAARAGFSSSARTTEAGPSLASTVLRIAAEEKVDLIAIPSSLSRDPVVRDFSVARKILRKSKSPLWIHRWKEESFSPEHARDIVDISLRNFSSVSSKTLGLGA